MSIEISQVVQRFQTYSGLHGDELTKWEHLCNDAAEEIMMRLVSGAAIEFPSQLVTAAASLAFYRYIIIQSVNELAFKAGDLSVTPKVSVPEAKLLWTEAEAAIKSLLKRTEDACFAFNAVPS